MKSYLLLTAAGSSSRMKGNGKKEYLPLGRGTVLSQALKTFLKSEHFDSVVITVPIGGQSEAETAVFADSEIKALLAKSTENQSKTELFFVEGSNTRQTSIFNALKFLEKQHLSEQATILVHDAARPYVTKQIIRDTLTATRMYGAAVPAVPAVDTQKEVAVSTAGSETTISRHLQRKSIVAVQTPQGFLFNQFFQCHEQAAKDGMECTDDTEIWDSYPTITGGRKVHIVTGDTANKKITYPEDIPMTESKQKTSLPLIRTGFGTDLHRLVEGRKLYLGGVEIPFCKGELGHSDGDVLLHAVTDALLGASGLGDIGSYFPPDENKWKDAVSSDLLTIVWNDIQKDGWQLINLDCVVEIEKPKFLPWRTKVIESIAEILGVEKTQVFVKAKTNEGLDAVGAGLAVKAYCTCLLTKNN